MSQHNFSLIQIEDVKDDNSTMVQFFLHRVENIVGKGENAGYQHFLPFPQGFQKTFFPESL